MSETLEASFADTLAPESSPADDLRSAIAAAFDEVESAPEAEAEEPPAEARERDERGRFASKDAPAEATEAKSEQAEEAPPVEAAAPPAIPPELAPVKGVLDEYKPLYAARGIAPDQAMRSLFEAQKILEERPVEAIQVLARQYGVDLSRFAPQQPAPEAQQTNDPHLAAVLSEVQQLKAELQAQKQQAIQQHEAEVHRSIEAFAADPKHPHFPTVRTMMGALMQAGTAKDLATAYDMACRAHPEVHQAMQKAEAEARAKADAEAKRKAAAEAKSRAVSVRGSAPVAGFVAPPEDRRALIEAVWDGRLN